MKKKTAAKYSWERITAIRNVGNLPSVCISVNSEDKLYALASGLLTHNTSGDPRQVPPAYIGRDGTVKVLDFVPENKRHAAIRQARPTTPPQAPDYQREASVEMQDAAYSLANKLSPTNDSEALPPPGNVDAEIGADGYIPTIEAVGFATRTLGKQRFVTMARSHPWHGPDPAVNAMVLELLSREVVRAAQNGNNVSQMLDNYVAQNDRAANITRLREEATMLLSQGFTKTEEKNYKTAATTNNKEAGRNILLKFAHRLTEKEVGEGAGIKSGQVVRTATTLYKDIEIREKGIPRLYRVPVGKIDDLLFARDSEGEFYSAKQVMDWLASIRISINKIEIPKGFSSKNQEYGPGWTPKKEKVTEETVIEADLFAGATVTTEKEVTIEESKSNRGATPVEAAYLVKQFYGLLDESIELEWKYGKIYAGEKSSIDSFVPDVIRGGFIKFNKDGIPYIANHQYALQELRASAEYARGYQPVPLAGDKSHWVNQINYSINKNFPNLDEETDLYVEPFGGGACYITNIDVLAKTKKPIYFYSATMFEPRKYKLYTGIQTATKEQLDAATAWWQSPDLSLFPMGEREHGLSKDDPLYLIGCWLEAIALPPKTAKSQYSILSEKATTTAIAQGKKAWGKLTQVMRRPNVHILEGADNDAYRQIRAEAKAGKRVTLFLDSNYADLPGENTKDAYKAQAEDAGYKWTKEMEAQYEQEVMEFLSDAPPVDKNDIHAKPTTKRAKDLLRQQVPTLRELIDAGGTAIVTNNATPTLVVPFLQEFWGDGAFYSAAIRSHPVPVKSLDADGTEYLRTDKTQVILSAQRPELLALFRKGLAYRGNVLEAFIDEHGRRNYRKIERNGYTLPAEQLPRSGAEAAPDLVRGDIQRGDNEGGKTDDRPKGETAKGVLQDGSPFPDTIPTLMAILPGVDLLGKLNNPPAVNTPKNDSSARGESRDSLEDESVSGNRPDAIPAGTGKDSKLGAKAESGSVASAGESRVGGNPKADGSAVRYAVVDQGTSGEYEAISAASRQPNVHIPKSGGVDAAITEGLNKALDARREIKKYQQQTAEKPGVNKQAYLAQEAAKTPEQITKETNEAYEVLRLTMGDGFLGDIRSQGATSPARRMRELRRKGAKLRLEGKTLSREDTEELRKIEEDEGQQMLFGESIAGYLPKDKIGRYTQGRLFTDEMLSGKTGGTGLLSSQGAQPRIDLSGIDQIEAQAMAEIDGSRTIGDPRLAHSMDNTRWMALDHIRREQFVAQKESDWEETAYAMLANDRTGTMQGILQKYLARESLTPPQTKAAEILISQLTTAGIYGEDKQKERQMATTLMLAVRETRAQTARTLAAFRDPHRTPAQRWQRFVGEVVFSPNKKTQALIDAAPPAAVIQSQIDGFLASFSKIHQEFSEYQQSVEGLTAWAENAMEKGHLTQELQQEIADTQAQIAELKSIASKEAIAAAATEEIRQKIEDRLAEMGLTIDDLLTAPIELRLMGSKIVGTAMEGFNARERQVLALAQGKLGGDRLSDLSSRMNIPESEVQDIMRRFREATKAMLADRFEAQAVTLDNLDTEGTKLRTDGGLLRSAPARRSRAEAEAMAEQALRMMGFFSPEEYDKINIKKNTKSRKKASKQEIVAALQKNEWVMHGEGLPLNELIDAAKKQNELPPPPMDNSHWKASVFDPENEAEMLQAAALLRRASRGVSAWDYANEIFIANLLSAPITAITNFTGFAYGIGRFTAGKLIRATINAGRKPTAEQFGEFIPMFQAAFSHIGTAFRNAITAFNTELPVTENLVNNDQMLFQYTDDIMGVVPGNFGKFIRLPLRSLLAVDEFSKTLFAYSHAAALAYREGKVAGKKGEEMQRFISAKMRDRQSSVWANSLKEARYVAFQQQLRSWQELRANGEPFSPAHFSEAALRMLSDFKSEDMSGASFAMQVGQFLVRTIFPFVRTPYRLLEIGLGMTPIGAATNLATALTPAHKLPSQIRQDVASAKRAATVAVGLAKKRPTPENKQKAKAAKEAVIKAMQALAADPKKGWITDSSPNRGLRILDAQAGAIVAGLIVAAMGRGVEGDDDDDKKWLLFTGTAPKDEQTPGMRQLHARTTPRQSIGIMMPDGTRTWIDYRRFDPLSTVLATNADLINQVKRTGKGQSGWNIPARLAASIYAQLLDKASLKGFSDLSATLSGDITTDLTNAAIERAVPFVVPNIVRNIARNSDPVSRAKPYQEGDALAQAAYAALPIAALAPKPALDVYGKEITKRGNVFSRSLLPGTVGTLPPQNPADKTIANWNKQHPDDTYAPASPSPKAIFSRYDKFKPTPEQVFRFSKMRGEAYSRLLREEGLVGLRRPTPDQMEKIKSLGGKATEEAKAAVWGK